MRAYFLETAVLVAGLASAAPRPQDIDFDLAYALPNPTYTTASDATAQIVTYNPSTVFSAALSQITASNSDTDTALDADSSTVEGLKRRSACAPQPSGYGPVADNATAFAALPAIASAAVNAPVPSGYTQAFSNLNGSSNAYGYMGYTTLKSYNSTACAAKCNAINGCISFNLFFERDPIVEPGSGCDNPASTTNIKCVFWGGPVSSTNAVNYGQLRDQFQVVVAGSNGYVNNSVASVPGYGPAVPLGNAAINASYNQFGYDTFLGNAIFIGAFDAQLCAAACTKKSLAALANPPTDGTPVQTCQFFNTYILYINTTSQVQGQYCAMYSQTWPSSKATNSGQYHGNDHFMIEYSFAYSNLTNPGAAQPLPAVYQAKSDIVSASAQPYCSSVLGNAPSAVPEPSVLVKYPASIITSACQLALSSSTTPSSSGSTSTTGRSTASSTPMVVSSSSVVSSTGSTVSVLATSPSVNVPAPTSSIRVSMGSTTSSLPVSSKSALPSAPPLFSFSPTISYFALEVPAMQSYFLIPGSPDPSPHRSGLILGSAGTGSGSDLFDAVVMPTIYGLDSSTGHVFVALQSDTVEVNRWLSGATIYFNKNYSGSTLPEAIPDILVPQPGFPDPWTCTIDPSTLFHCQDVQMPDGQGIFYEYEYSLGGNGLAMQSIPALSGIPRLLYARMVENPVFNLYSATGQIVLDFETRYEGVSAGYPIDYVAAAQFYGSSPDAAATFMLNPITSYVDVLRSPHAPSGLDGATGGRLYYDPTQTYSELRSLVGAGGGASKPNNMPLSCAIDPTTSRFICQYGALGEELGEAIFYNCSMAALNITAYDPSSLNYTVQVAGPDTIMPSSCESVLLFAAVEPKTWPKATAPAAASTAVATTNATAVLFTLSVAGLPSYMTANNVIASAGIMLLDTGAGSVFSLDPSTGHVTGPDGNLIYYAFNEPMTRLVGASSADEASQGDLIPLVCAIDPSSFRFSCQFDYGGPMAFFYWMGALQAGFPLAEPQTGFPELTMTAQIQ